MVGVPPRPTQQTYSYCHIVRAEPQCHLPKISRQPASAQCPSAIQCCRTPPLSHLALPHSAPLPLGPLPLDPLPLCPLPLSAAALGPPAYDAPSRALSSSVVGSLDERCTAPTHAGSSSAPATSALPWLAVAAAAAGRAGLDADPPAAAALPAVAALGFGSESDAARRWIASARSAASGRSAAVRLRVACRCGGEPGPGADAAGVSPVPAQMRAGVTGVCLGRGRGSHLVQRVDRAHELADLDRRPVRRDAPIISVAIIRMRLKSSSCCDATMMQHCCNNPPAHPSVRRTIAAAAAPRVRGQP